MNYPDGYMAIPYLCELFMINDVILFITQVIIFLVNDSLT